ncbi:DNA replication ATP-dependent helicase/nuclease DNA2 isoform X1 [Pangasianodon hypophthalmus]|uniref:DNA replication ATP-dependent helicase/nuclease DNA2 isoform X1 n=1 Tax=Pangasianodon hypophthalmus TaxID=310915 RepID=UPI002307869F|nr:DNA replication ATP-dependent helicase/nuclease DNA2 isoform X1 [Pangasianodon hypophthalmus]
MSTMSKMKSKKNMSSSGLQSDISAFFSKGGRESGSYPRNTEHEVQPKSPKRGTAMHTNVDVSSVMKTCARQDTRFPLSPLTIPETPESEKKRHCPTQPFSEGPCSPVSRCPGSRGLACKTRLLSSRSLQPQNKTSPKSGDTFEAENGIGHFGSVKRLMHGSETFQKAKRPRTGQLQKSSEQESSSEGDDLSKFLQIIRETADLKDEKSMKGFSKNSEKKSGKAVKTLSEKNSSLSTLSAKILGNMTSEKKNGATGSITKLPRVSHHKISSSEDEKENIPVRTEPSTDLTEISSDNQSDLVVSYTSWVCNSDSGEKKENVLIWENEKKSEQVKNLGENEKAITTAEEDVSILDDSWFTDQMEQSFEEPEHKKSKLEKKRSIPEHVILLSGLHNRYWVLDVQETTGAQGYNEKHLTITCSKSSHPTATCILKDGWESTPVAVGDIVHLEGECVSGLWVIDRNSGYLVLLPDVLISGTSIANSVRCMRRAVLGEMFKSLDGGSKQMLNGTIVHDIFQKAAMSLDFSPEMLEKLASEALLNPNYLGQMYSLKLTQADMKQEVEEYLPAIAEWAKDYLHTSLQARQKQLTLRLPSDGALSRQDSHCSITVTDFVDIEENIWAPRFGLKGKIDVTAGVRIHRRGRKHVDKIVPLELKTGKESNSIEHRSQVILYTLMSTERRTDAEAGFLVYLKTGNLHPIVGNHMDRRELIKLRNSLVHHLSNSLIKLEGKSQMACLPEVISDQQACKYCPQRRNCALYNRAVEKAPGACPSEDPQAFLQLESEHLNQLHLQYFSHWLLLCSLEALTMESKGGRRNIWLQSAQEREKNGGCVGNMVLAGKVSVLSDGVYVHHFKRRQGEHAFITLIVGDRVVISDQDSRFIGIATGYITEITNTGVTCYLDKNLSKYSSDMVFRLDQDEGAGGLSTHLGNLSVLMENSPNSERLRQLIVEFKPPQFIDSLSSVLPREAKDTVANILKGLNKPQKQAMKKVLLSKDYTLIVGMPGTGKTTTICTLVRILHACGFSVLLTSYTHSAVDNILLKLKKFKVGFLRLGRAQKVHRDILPFTEEQNRTRGINTLDQLEDLYNKELVVATTCMGVKHPIFSRRRFDFCIVDEASQISQPVCLGPLFYAQRFVLVGDHQQLPPIVQNAEARALGMDESLFKRLEHHSQAVVQLNVQYRMNSMIMSLSNALMYEGRLECGSERTANAQLQLPCRAALENELYVCQPQDTAWVHAVLEPQKSVCFLDTSQVPALETVEKGGVSNHTEAILVHALVSLLLKAGCRASDIGVIAPYRQQIKAISTLLEEESFRAVEVNTVDKYQGRDKSVIIVSFVRSHTEGNLGELLKDWRRLNVAITRAKHKLLMLGSAPTLRLYAPLEKLLTHMQQENMICQLPPAAHEALPHIKM